MERINLTLLYILSKIYPKYLSLFFRKFEKLSNPRLIWVCFNRKMYIFDQVTLVTNTAIDNTETLMKHLHANYQKFHLQKICVNHSFPQLKFCFPKLTSEKVWIPHFGESWPDPLTIRFLPKNKFRVQRPQLSMNKKMDS